MDLLSNGLLVRNGNLRKQSSWEIEVTGEFLKESVVSPAPSLLPPGFYEVICFALLDAVMFSHTTGPETNGAKGLRTVIFQS